MITILAITALVSLVGVGIVFGFCLANYLVGK